MCSHNKGSFYSADERNWNFCKVRFEYNQILQRSQREHGKHRIDCILVAPVMFYKNHNCSVCWKERVSCIDKICKDSMQVIFKLMTFLMDLQILSSGAASRSIEGKDNRQKKERSSFFGITCSLRELNRDRSFLLVISLVSIFACSFAHINNFCSSPWNRSRRSLNLPSFCKYERKFFHYLCDRIDKYIHLCY